MTGGQNIDDHFAESQIWSFLQKYFSNYLRKAYYFVKKSNLKTFSPDLT